MEFSNREDRTGLSVNAVEAISTLLYSHLAGESGPYFSICEPAYERYFPSLPGFCCAGNFYFRHFPADSLD